MNRIVQNFIVQKKLFQQEDRLLLAVSGGMDSMVMTAVLLDLGYTIGLTHCNFKLRGEASDADEQLVIHWAKQRDVPFYGKAFDTKTYAAQHKLSTQMAARELRYSFFAAIKEKEGYDYLLTAHHLDDRLETFWLNFSRGTGLKGLVSLQAKTGDIRRPLLCVNRAQIANYQEEKSVIFREDESNASDVYRRNAFRHKVLPSLYEWESDLKDRMPANFERLEQMYQVYSAAVKKELSGLTRTTANGLAFDREILQEHAASETMIWELLSPYGFIAEDCRQALAAKAGTLLSTANWQLLIQEKELLLQEHITIEKDEIYLWEEKDALLSLSSMDSLAKAVVNRPNQLCASPQVAIISQKKLVYPLKVRRWLAGDSFCPLGMGGKHQKLQDFFTNNKIDRFQRQQQWLLVNGDGEIIWVIGRRLDERFKVVATDRRVLEVHYSNI